MQILGPTTETLPQTPARTAIVWLSIVVLLVAFYQIEHSNRQVSLLEAFAFSGDDLINRAVDGDMGRRMGIPAIAILGVFLLLRRDGWQLRLNSYMSWLMIGYLGWCGLSILWSIEPPVTLKRFSVLLLGSIGALGVARAITLRELCLITLVVTTILILNSVYTEVSLGTFQPWSEGYRFAGNLHPNVQAPYCATMALAAAFYAGQIKRGRIFIWALCLLGVGLLVLTKSRTVCGSSLIGVAAFFSVGVPWAKRISVVATVLWLGCTAVLAAYLLGWDIEREIVNTVLIGRQEDAESLSGRLPLWSQLMPYIGDNFLLGHGFLTFWNPRRIDSFSRALGWGVPDGHCAYLDSLLDLGIIGATISMAAVFSGVLEARRQYFTIGQAGYGFLFAVLLCRSLTAFLESAFSTPTSFPAFIMLCGLANLGFCGEPFPSAVTEESPQGLEVPALS
jgi:exopolysaccharide production protein ExoQ